MLPPVRRLISVTVNQCLLTSAAVNRQLSLPLRSAYATASDAPSHIRERCDRL